VKVRFSTRARRDLISIFEVRVDTVHIAAILHSARDHERILFSED
jgi:plasmid stabilization system protein ParE